MAFTSRFKEKFESRSSSRRSSLSQAQYAQAQSEEPRTVTPNPARVSLENSAFHVSRGGAYRKSAELPATRQELGYQHEYAQTDRSHDRGSSQLVHDAVPDRRSSRYQPPSTDQQVRRKSLPQSPPADLVPQRASSRPVMRDSTIESVTSANGQIMDTDDIAPTRRSSKAFGAANPYFKASEVPARKATRKDMKHSDFSADMEREMDQIAESMKHMKLPPGWNLNNTVQTHVNEIHRPAVTSETIIKERTEIIQEEITRDIHIHHYYTYLQPVRVVEVLPAKHFIIDHRTGQKVEIAAPPGWVLPENMTPRSPDTSFVKGWTRHYLVNEAHPRGIVENIQEKHEPMVNGHNPVRAF